MPEVATNTIEKNSDEKAQILRESMEEVERMGNEGYDDGISDAMAAFRPRHLNGKNYLYIACYHNGYKAGTKKVQEEIRSMERDVKTPREEEMRSNSANKPNFTKILLCSVAVTVACTGLGILAGVGVGKKQALQYKRDLSLVGKT